LRNVRADMAKTKSWPRRSSSIQFRGEVNHFTC
jgi:hypothetical protein